VSGWPDWLKRADGERKAKVLETSAYYDAVNFARKFKGQSLVGANFIDPSCPPTTVYAAFNVLPGPKRMIASQLGGAISARPGPRPARHSGRRTWPSDRRNDAGGEDRAFGPLPAD
jgi:hypothetical protein